MSEQPLSTEERVREIVGRAEVSLVSGSCNVPGHRPSVTVRFYDDDWRDLQIALSFLHPA